MGWLAVVDQLPELQAAEVLRLQPGDIVVLRFPRRVPHEMVTRIREDWRKLTKSEHALVVLDEGATLSVLRNGEMVSAG